MMAAIVAQAKLDANHADDGVHEEVFDEFLAMMAQVEKDIPAPAPNSAAEPCAKCGYSGPREDCWDCRAEDIQSEVRALREALEQITEYEGGGYPAREMRRIARTALDQAKGDE